MRAGFAFALPRDECKAWLDDSYLPIFNFFGMTLLICAAPVALIYLALGIICAAELTMHRIAEHPKRPIVAFSLILVAAAAF